MPHDAFVVDAQDILGPSLEELGFTLSRAGPQLVEYRSPNLAVSIFQGNKSSTIGLEISRGGELINLAHLMDVSGATHPGMTVRTRAVIRQRLTWLRDFLMSQFHNVLLGNEQEFQNLVGSARLHDERYNFKLVVAPTIEQAGHAFHERRYQEVVDLLGPLEPHLGSIAKRQLSFAKNAVARQRTAR
jgi:hypothetical protein